MLLIVAPLKTLSVKRFTLLYFAFIGLGFMVVEISLMQQLILFLGQPTYSVTAVLFCILLFSGLGSYTSHRIRWKKGFLFLVIFLGLLIVGLSPVIHAFLGLPVYAKTGFVLAVLAPLSFFMGIPFPTGITVVGENQIPYAWCVNGCFSVCGSVVSVIVALSFGFQVVLVLGLVCYCAAFLVRACWVNP